MEITKETERLNNIRNLAKLRQRKFYEKNSIVLLEKRIYLLVIDELNRQQSEMFKLKTQSIQQIFIHIFI